MTLKSLINIMLFILMSKHNKIYGFNSRKSLLMKFNNFREIKEVCYFDKTAKR